MSNQVPVGWMNPKEFDRKIWHCECGYCQWLRRQFTLQGMSEKLDWPQSDQPVSGAGDPNA